MKLSATAENYDRWSAAVLRNCLAYALAPLDCPIRKCRRDGLCSGPLVATEAGRARLAPADGDGTRPDAAAVPICYVTLDEAVRDMVTRVCAAHHRELRAQPGATVIETTRVIASRRWRRLDWIAAEDGSDAGTEDDAAPETESGPRGAVISPALC
ncbi:MAG: hypothetical protein KL863_20400 [Rhizobium sp.]|nr:hypothetical protein [Rhizobium sp.]